MIKDRLSGLFVDLEDDVKAVILKVLDIEQSYISMKNPRGVIKDVEQAITQVAEKKPD